MGLRSRGGRVCRSRACALCPSAVAAPAVRRALSSTPSPALASLPSLCGGLTRTRRCLAVLSTAFQHGPKTSAIAQTLSRSSVSVTTTTESPISAWVERLFSLPGMFSSRCLCRLFQVLSPAARHLLRIRSVSPISRRGPLCAQVRSERSAVLAPLSALAFGSRVRLSPTPFPWQQTQHLLMTVTCVIASPRLWPQLQRVRKFFFFLHVSLSLLQCPGRCLAPNRNLMGIC